MIETDELELETHFVENPFIKMREKANKKKIDSKLTVGVADLEKGNLEDEDIVFMADDSRFVIKDLE